MIYNFVLTMNPQRKDDRSRRWAFQLKEEERPQSITSIQENLQAVPNAKKWRGFKVPLIDKAQRVYLDKESATIFVESENAIPKNYFLALDFVSTNSLTRYRKMTQEKEKNLDILSPAPQAIEEQKAEIDIIDEIEQDNSQVEEDQILFSLPFSDDLIPVVCSDQQSSIAEPMKRFKFKT